MKKIISFLLIILTIPALYACGSKPSGDISMYDLNKAICEKADFSEMQYASSGDQDPEDLFSNISDMDYAKVKAFFVSYAADGKGNADEIAVIQVKDAGNTSEAAASLNDHLAYRKSLYKTYDSSQLDKLDKAIVCSYEDLAILIVADQPETLKIAFLNFVQA